MEKECKWHFKEEGGRDVGPNDPVDEKFKGQPYYSIVRESIQNSLDAVKDPMSPVKVSFKFYELNRKDYPNFFEIENNIIQCANYYSDNDNAKRLFGDMVKYLNGDEENKKKLKLTCLRISDYNTKGMAYSSQNTNSAFYAFLRAGGVSAKTQGSGGSFGFGKGAYYTLSPIKTIVVSTRDENNKVIFEGSSILTTHKDKSGKKLTAYGYYDNNGGEPTEKEQNIPEIFRRSDIGTDVNIIGLWDEKERKKLMIKSVLNNFWLSIHDGKLIVEFDDLVIEKQNLEQNINEYFTNELESGNANEIEFWNPKPYFKAVKYAGNNEQYRVFEGDLEILGKVKFYVYLEKGLPNRVSYFRKPKMVVVKKTNRKINGYAAVFICESDEGNEILRKMENPAHNEWRKENYPKAEGKIDKIARKAEVEVSNFVNEKLEILSKSNTSKKIAFLGLEDYLSIPQELLEKAEEADFDGMNSNTTSGKHTTELSEKETGMQTTNKANPVKIIPSLKSQPEVKEETEVDLDEEAEPITAGGNNEEEGGSVIPDPADGDQILKGNADGDESTSKVFVHVDFKVAAQSESGNVFHTLIINSKNEIENAELELLVSADNDRDDGMEIASSNKGTVSKNTLKNVKLSKGKNQIKVRFSDNLKHSVKIKAYEIQ